MDATTQSVDLEKVVRDWSLREYDKNPTWRERRLHQKEKKNANNHLGVDIDWSRVKFRDETTWPNLAEEKEDVEGTDSAKVDIGNIKGNVIFQTKFTNDSADDHEYTMKTEKRTQSTCETVIENSFTRGMEMSVALKTPGEIFEANAGYSRETTLTNSTGETQEEELSWGVESQIKVKARHVAHAALVVEEKKYKGEFLIRTKVSGTVLVRFTNIQKNHAQVKAVSCSIGKIVSEFIGMERKKKTGALPFIVVGADGTVTVTTKGHCKFRFGIKQEVVVTVEKISE